MRGTVLPRTEKVSHMGNLFCIIVYPIVVLYGGVVIFRLLRAKISR